MERVRTLKKMTKEEIDQEIEQHEREIAERIALLDAPDLTEEEKEVLVRIKMALENEENGEWYTPEEIRELLF